MAQPQNSPVLRYIHKLFEREELAGLSDRQLLQRFAGQRCEEAFTVLVRRHGPMVFGVCSRVLKEAADAEDALQATFLVLARRARGFGWQDSIANWLYGVALRVASKMRSQRQRSRDVTANFQSAATTESTSLDPSVESIRRELTEKLDDSLRRLPDKYRTALVLSYLEGKTHQEVARELKLPVGSVSRHVARGLDLLRDRLSRTGLCMSLEVLAALLAQESWRPAIQPALAESVCETALAFQAGALAASGAVSARILTLAEGVSRTMFVTQLKYVAAALFAFGALGIGGVMHGPWNGDAPDGTVRLEQAPITKAPDGSPGVGAPLNAEKATPLSPAERARRHRALWNKLDTGTDMTGVDRMPFGELKQYMEQRFGLHILVNEMALKAIGLENVQESPVKLEILSGVPFRVVLQMVLDQIGATYLLRGEFIEVTTPDAASPETWVHGDRNFVPRVCADFKDTPLDEALHELAMQTGISVILDRRELDGMTPRVTALLNNICLDTAVEILANMSGMKSVALDRSLYVTGQANAVHLVEEQQRQRFGSVGTQQEKSKAPAAKANEKKNKEQPNKE
jgi:RNA polymerase sigma factor (sigma-70 family)